MDEHSSLLRKSVNYGRKKFYSTGPQWSYWSYAQIISPASFTIQGVSIRMMYWGLYY